jgi:hypothetical protein
MMIPKRNLGILSALVGLCFLFAGMYLFDRDGNDRTPTSNLAAHVSVSVRGSAGRNLQAEYFDFDKLELDDAAAGFLVGFVCLLLLVACLCCCCCRPGRGCSLWDLLACYCCYEICCDDAQIGSVGDCGDFRLI